MNDTREHILRVAFNLFLQKSYRDVTLKEIVDKTGLSKGAFYHYFPSKETLFLEIIDNYLLASQELLFKGMPMNNLKQFMLAYLERMIGFFDGLKSEIESVDGRMAINYFSLAFDALRIVPGFPEKIDLMHAKERAAWVEVFKNARANGEIATSMSDLQLARIFVALNDGIGMHQILEGKLEELPGEIFNIWMGIYNQIKTQ